MKTADLSLSLPEKQSHRRLLNAELCVFYHSFSSVSHLILAILSGAADVEVLVPVTESRSDQNLICCVPDTKDTFWSFDSRLDLEIQNLEHTDTQRSQ